MKTLAFLMTLFLFSQNAPAAIHCLFEKSDRSPRQLLTMNDDKTLSVKTQSGGYSEGRWMKQSKNPELAAQMQKTYSALSLNAQEKADFHFLLNGISKSGYFVISDSQTPQFLVATKKKSVKLNLANAHVLSGRCLPKK